MPQQAGGEDRADFAQVRGQVEGWGLVLHGLETIAAAWPALQDEFTRNELERKQRKQHALLSLICSAANSDFLDESNQKRTATRYETISCYFFAQVKPLAW